MDMKIKRSYLRIATSMALLLAGLGCQTAKKPVSALPAFQASPPPIQASAPARTSPAPTTAKPTAPVRSVIQRRGGDNPADLVHAPAERDVSEDIGGDHQQHQNSSFRDIISAF